MKAMKLTLYTTTYYTCIKDTHALYEPESAVRRLKSVAEQTSAEICDDEIAVFTTRDRIFRSEDNSIFFGAGPAEGQAPEGFHTRELPEGPYFFYQFPDISTEGIQAALQFAHTSLSAKGFTPASDEVILRGVKEAGFYVLQVLIPLDQTTQA